MHFEFLSFGSSSSKNSKVAEATVLGFSQKKRKNKTEKIDNEIPHPP